MKKHLHSSDLHTSKIDEKSMSKDMFHTVWGPQTIAKLVQITPITMVYGTYNYSYWGL